MRLTILATGLFLFLAPCLAQPAAAAGNDASATLRAAVQALGTVPRTGALFTQGTLSTAGQNGTFTGWLDLRNGYNVSHAVLGPLSGDQGYDGASWSAANGITTVDDLPATQARNVTTIYLALDGWSAPKPGDRIADAGTQTDGGKPYRVIAVVPHGGVPATIWFDARTHLIARTDLATDAGTVTDRYADYRRVAGMQLAYRDENRDPSGVVSTSVLTRAAIEALPAGALARTPSVERGWIVGGGRLAQMPFRFSFGTTGNIAIPVAYGHNQPALAVFDTGGRNLLTLQGARSLGFATGGGFDIGGVGTSTVRASIANVGTVSAGNATLVDQQAFVLPMPYGLQSMFATEPVVGLVGFELLSNFQTTIDYAAQTIAFAPFATPAALPSGATVLPFLSNGSTPYVEASIDGVSGLFMVDTGNAGNLVVFKSFVDAHALFRGAASVSYVSAGGVGGTVPLRRLRARSLRLAGTTLDAPIVEVTDQKSGAFASKTLAGNIGATVLRRFTVQLNYQSRTLAFAPDSRVAEPFLSDRTGLSLARDPTGYLILGAAPNTPAADAHLAAGDHIDMIDGTSADKLSAADFYNLTTNPGIATIQFGITRKGETAPIAITLTPRTLL
ncbi:MAG TPA: aspartyl protease family protein [Candidatus Tumulicola sp.]|jgi:hypothetical protein